MVGYTDTQDSSQLVKILKHYLVELTILAVIFIKRNLKQFTGMKSKAWIIRGFFF